MQTYLNLFINVIDFIYSNAFILLRSSVQHTDLQQLSNVQMLSAHKPQQIIENNNNQPLMDPSQKRRLSRSQENNIIDKTSLPLDNHNKSTNDSHYIKNKTLQSPVNRYKVCDEEKMHSRFSSNGQHDWTHFHFTRIFPSFSRKTQFQELEEKTTKKSTQLISSTLTHSNSELNSICPHKGSTKSKQLMVEFDLYALK